MRLLRLEVENFRGVRSAKLDFGPGVNVLHGPNELGKSTLAEAVRAALLTKPSSTQADAYLRWDRAVPTRVALTFEVGGDVWRVTKRFSSPSSALLERQVGAAGGQVAHDRAGRKRRRQAARASELGHGPAGQGRAVEEGKLPGGGAARAAGRVRADSWRRASKATRTTPARCRSPRRSAPSAAIPG